MRPVLLFVAFVLMTPLRAELREVVLYFQPSECASCTQSLPERFQRIRGVEAVQLDAAGNALRIGLGAGNRVRLSRLRETLQQDGTKLLRTTVTGTGECAKGDAGQWTFQPLAGEPAVAIEASPEPAAGACSVEKARVR